MYYYNVYEYYTLGWFRDLKIQRKVLCTMQHADNFVLLAKEEILVSFKHNFKRCCKLLHAMNKLLTSFLCGRKDSTSSPWPSQSLILSGLMHFPLKYPD